MITVWTVLRLNRHKQCETDISIIIWVAETEVETSQTIVVSLGAVKQGMQKVDHTEAWTYKTVTKLIQKELKA
jgi:hypothetical protein